MCMLYDDMIQRLAKRSHCKLGSKRDGFGNLSRFIQMGLIIHLSYQQGICQ
jgi:hypothetical protein